VLGTDDTRRSEEPAPVPAEGVEQRATGTELVEPLPGELQRQIEPGPDDRTEAGSRLPIGGKSDGQWQDMKQQEKRSKV
jgi:hypothetical protein